MVEVEDERLVAYPDTNGTLTIGVGHTGPDVTKGLHITPERSRQLLRSDLAVAVNCVNSCVRVPLTEAQWIALVSFTFNEGTGAFRTSTLLRLLNDTHYASVPVQLKRWNKETIRGRKVVNQGLVNRREAEIKLWNTPE